jgi:hypothetical protein
MSLSAQNGHAVFTRRSPLLREVKPILSAKGFVPALPKLEPFLRRPAKEPPGAQLTPAEDST